MMPAIGIFAIGSGERRAVPLPIPVFLIWPFVGLGLAVVGLVQIMRPKNKPFPPALVGARTALLAFCQLRGLKVDVQTSDDKRVHIWFV